MKQLAFGLFGAFVLVGGACSGRDDAVPTPTVEASAAPSATPTLPPPSATTTSGIIEVPSRALLIDATSGKVTVLYESLTDAAWQGRFDADVVELSVRGGERRYNLNGTAASPANGPTCRSASGFVEINGRQFTDVPNCGAFSPDGRWMTFERPQGEVLRPDGLRLPSWDQWVLDVVTGETLELQKGLLHCGGCDGRYGPRWSPTSRYLAYAEFGGPRRFLSDVTISATRLIGGGNEVTFAPQWARTGNRIIYSTGQTIPATARFEDLDRGTATDLPIPWPVNFDASGDYLYSPAWAASPKETGKFTTVISASTFSPVATLSGAPAAWLSWRPADSPIAVGQAGLVAALQGAAGCEGTAITVGTAVSVCIQDGASGAVNSTASMVVVAKAAGVTGPARGPGFETVALTRYNIELFEPATGRTRTAVSDALSWDYQSPVMVWNAAGTHLLVIAPSTTGL